MQVNVSANEQNYLAQFSKIFKDCEYIPVEKPPDIDLEKFSKPMPMTDTQKAYYTQWQRRKKAMATLFKTVVGKEITLPEVLERRPFYERAFKEKATKEQAEQVIKLSREFQFFKNSLFDMLTIELPPSDENVHIEILPGWQYVWINEVEYFQNIFLGEIPSDGASHLFGILDI